MLHHFSRWLYAWCCEGSWAGETEWRQGQRSDTSPGGAKSWTFTVDESYMTNIANHLWMVDTPAKDVIFSIISIVTVHDFFYQYHFEGLMSQGKTTDVFETHLQQGEAIHLSPSFGGYLHNIASWLKSRVPFWTFWGQYFWATPIWPPVFYSRCLFYDPDLSFFKRCFFTANEHWKSIRFWPLVPCPLPWCHSFCGESSQPMPWRVLKSQQTTFLDLTVDIL